MKDSNRIWKEQQARMNAKAMGLDPTETFYGTNRKDTGIQQGDCSGYCEHKWGDPDVVVQSYADPSNTMYWCGGFRFPNITIPKGSVVTSAKFRSYLQFTMEDSANFKIYGNLVADALDFNDLPEIIREAFRPRTTVYVEVVDIDRGTGWHEITGLEHIINELLALPDWKSGNAIALLFIANTDFVATWMPVTYWENTTPHSLNPQLEISWIPPGPPPPCDEWLTQEECEAANCYWYDEACHSTPYVPPIPPVDLPTIAGAGLAVVDAALVGYYLLKRFKII